MVRIRNGKSGELQFTPPHIQNLFKWQYRWVVSMSKTVTYRDQGKLKQGVLVIDINFRTIDELSGRISLGKKVTCTLSTR